MFQSIITGMISETGFFQFQRKGIIQVTLIFIACNVRFILYMIDHHPYFLETFTTC